MSVGVRIIPSIRPTQGGSIPPFPGIYADLMEINGFHDHPMLIQALDPSVPPNLIVDTQVHNIVDNSDISDDERKSHPY